MNYAIHQYNHSTPIVKTGLAEFWLCRIQKGTVTISFEQERYKVFADSVFVIPEGAQFKEVSSSRDMRMEVLVFYEPLMNVVYSLLGAEADFGTLEMVFWSDKTLEEPFNRMLTADYELLRDAIEQSDLIARNKIIMASLVHLLLVLYNGSTPSVCTSSKDNCKRSRQLLNHFFELVSENTLLGQRSIAFYAEKLCISERYLFKICKKETGKTPKILVNEYIIGQIKNALLTSEMTLQQVADRFNFPDQSAFGQFFKRQEGISPSEFRQKYR
ncbi:MAG: helix-turn-helix domain-containing protein [Bacteroidales bacterium]|nr:helix-turn-helix domain-containing protein [Bacteroidales bacterium]